MFLCKLFRMAEDDHPSKSIDNQNEDGSSESEPPLPLRLDLGDDPSVNIEPNRLGNQNGGPSGTNQVGNETHRREENPFSFKHFLRSDSGSSSHNKIVRPQVYKESRSASTDFGSQNIPEPKQSARVVPELSSALPDFVQDHLIIEQCYLGGNNGASLDLNGINLPDFTQTRNDSPRTSSICSNVVPLDLPIRAQVPFPLDLPISNSSSSSRNCSGSEVGNSKSLPDFLADSAVCTQKGENASSVNSPEGELEMLRQDLETVRRQYAEQSRTCESLNREMDWRKKKEEEYVNQLTKSLEYAEQNLETANRRALAAENTVMKLKQEVKSLTVLVNKLTKDSEHLRNEASTSHGISNSINALNSHRLAEELRTAASTAELSLRQLLNGVDNIRMMADSLDNMDRIDEKQDQFSQSDEDTGPAL